MASARIVLVLQPAGRFLRLIPRKSSVSAQIWHSGITAPSANSCCGMQARYLTAPIGNVGLASKNKKPAETTAATVSAKDLPQKEATTQTPKEKSPATGPKPTMKIIPAKSEKPAEPPKEMMTVEYSEKFIPLTRSSVVRHLMEEKDFLTEEEMKKYESFALSLDAAVVNRYHNQLQELKSLFDPINPDKDTIKTRSWNRRERLDNEFWVIQKLSAIMEKANFQELPRTKVEKALAEHKAGEGVMVSVDMSRYDVLRFWALGREIPVHPIPLYQRLGQRILGQPEPEPIEYYKRVVVAVRLKKDDKLMLKAFKEVPVNALEQLLPDGKVVMSKFDQGIIYGSLGLAGAGIVAKVVATMAHVHMDWTMVLTLVTGLFGFRWWTMYKNRQNSYLLQLSRMLYFKNVANNRGLLTLLVDRAEDELFKELLLTYSFLLTNRPPSAAAKSSQDQLPSQLGCTTQGILESRIEDWVLKKTGTKIKFDATEAIQMLTTQGILNQDMEKNLFVLPLHAARSILPVAPQTLSPREQDYDSVEAFEYEETGDDYQKEVKKRRLFGWF